MSYHPLRLYDPDSDDSSSDGGSIGGRAHASMGIINDRCGRDNDSDRFSIDSNLMESVDDNEMDDPMLYSAKYNPLHLRVEMGKRVGIDSDDESDGDGSHMGEDHDFSPLRTNYKGKGDCDGDIDEHSIGSDDEFGVRNIPKAFTRDDAEFDALIPTGNPRQETTGGADQPDDAFAPDDTDDQHGSKKASQKRRQEERYTKAEAEGKQAGVKAERRGKREVSKQLVAQALAKARESTSVTGRAHLEARARELAKGTLTGKTVIRGGKTVREVEGNIAGATLSPAVREKGAKALSRFSKAVATGKGIQRGRLAEQFDERQKEEMAKARVRKQKAGVVSIIKGVGRTDSGEGRVVSGVGRKGIVGKSTAETSSNLQIMLRKAVTKVTQEEGDGRATALRQLVSRNLKSKALSTLLTAYREAKAKNKEEIQKTSARRIISALRKSVAKTKAEAELVRILIQEKLAKERASVGGGASVAQGGGASVAQGGGASVSGETGNPASVGGEVGRVEVDGGSIVEIRPYGSQIRVFFNDQEIKATKTSTESDAVQIEQLIEQIKSRYGATAHSDIRKKLGDRAQAIRKKLGKK